MIFQESTITVLRSFVLLSNMCIFTPILAENTLVKHNFHHQHHNTGSNHRVNSTQIFQTFASVQNSQLNDEELKSQENITKPSSITSAFQLLTPNRRLTRNVYSGENNKDSGTSGTVTNNIVKVQADGCRSGCANQQRIDNLSKDTIRSMRLNHVKEQILKKLNLKEPPNTENIPIYPLPSALTRELAGSSHPDKNYDQDEEDFFGHTEEVIVFLENATSNCIANQTDPHLCFTFQIPHEMDHKKVSSAELWVYKRSSIYSERKHVFWVGEQLPEPISYQTHNVTIGEGWVKLNISTNIISWHEHRRERSRARSNRFSRPHTFQIGCKTCRGNAISEFPFDIHSRVNRPFVVVHIAAESTRKRSRRNTNCSPDFSECCRESFIVKFEEIGWDNWIIAPQQYEAYYCKGNCVNINGITHSKAHHTSIMQRYIQVYGINNRTEELVPCCSASRLSSISLLYRNENTTIKRVLPNMVVQSCGCL